MTKGKLDKLLNRFGAYWSGYVKASSDVDKASCQKGMQDVSGTIWANMELEKAIQSREDTQKYLDMVLKLKEQFDHLSNALDLK